MLRMPVEQSESGAIDGFHMKASICELGIRYIAWLAYRYHVDRSRLEPGSITEAANALYIIAQHDWICRCGYDQASGSPHIMTSNMALAESLLHHVVHEMHDQLMYLHI
jgi:hypothetical protein